MDIENIKTNKELVKKLNSIHKSLTSLMKDDASFDRFSYTDFNISPSLDAKAVNQHIAENRMRKIHSLVELSENWDAFKTLYKEDIILKKIGVEFLEGKFEFNKEILDTIKGYPHRKEVLYYFNKDVDVDLHVIPEDYNKIKQQILPTIQEESLIHLQQKTSLIKAIDRISSDKSQNNIDYISNLTNENNPNGKLNVEYGRELYEIMSKIKSGDFIAQQDENQMIVELPIPGIKKEGDKSIPTSSILLNINLNNPKDYAIEVGSIKDLQSNIEDRINAIREKALNIKGSKKDPKIG